MRGRGILAIPGAVLGAEGTRPELVGALAGPICSLDEGRLNPLGRINERAALGSGILYRFDCFERDDESPHDPHGRELATADRAVQRHL
jgi:hypothetical protein